MNILEKEIEDIIFEAENKKLRERGLFVYGKKKRQLKIGNYGIADIVFYSINFDYETDVSPDLENNLIYTQIIQPYLLVNIVELKQDKINASTFFQALRYVKGISSYLEKNKEELLVKYKITLIGKTCDTASDFIYIPDLLTGGNLEVSFYTYSFKFDGIYFKEISGYKLIEDGF